MEKSNLFFTYLGKLKSQKEISEKDKNTKEELNKKANEIPKPDSEWLQEYEVIYQSYSFE